LSWFDRSSAAFDNPDHVAIVIHDYRWRLGLADGERKYDDLEKKLAQGPVITVPTITMECDSNRARHPDPRVITAKSRGSMSTGSSRAAWGTTCPRKPHRPFAQAIVDVVEVRPTLAWVPPSGGWSMNSSRS
jgi:hypothetical protein